MKNVSIRIVSLILLISPSVSSRLYLATDMNSVDQFGSSDLGDNMSKVYQEMTSYTGMKVFSGNTTSNIFSGGQVFDLNLSMSESAEVRFSGGSSNPVPASPTGFQSNNFLVRLVNPISAGGTFRVTFNSPQGLSSLLREGTGSGVHTPDQGAGTNSYNRNSTLNQGRNLLAARTQGSTTSSYAASIDITGVLFDGSAPDYSITSPSLATTGLLTSTSPSTPSSLLFHWGTSDTSPSHGSGTATLENSNSAVRFYADPAIDPTVTPREVGAAVANAPADDLFAWRDMTAIFTAGADGFDAGQVFRFSIDGGSLDLVPVPEPSTSLLSLIAISCLAIRRKRL